MKSVKRIVGIIVFVSVVCVILYFISNKKSSNMMGNNVQKQSSSITIDSIDLDVDYSEVDQTEEYSDYTAEINLDEMSVNGSNVKIEDGKILITSEGVYYFTGTTEDGNIEVKADDNDKVILVFDNANITSSKTAVVNGISADKIVINLKEGSENTFTDSKEYTEFSEDEEPDATIFSKTDMTINGKGSLTINANYKDGIASKDTLKIINSNITVKSNDDGIRGKDKVILKDAILDVTSVEDGIKSTNEEEEGKGFVYVDGGNIEISAGDDGIHGEQSLVIKAGDINITKSNEGLEAQCIEIDDGTINIVASDDGINVNGGTDEFGMPGQEQTVDEGRVLIIKGGTINVNADGDGLDSNGSVKVTGGTIIVAGAKNGGNGALDYTGTFEITGGSLIYYGATGMWQDSSDSSTLNTVSYEVNGNAGDEIELQDENGKVVMSVTTEKNYGRISFVSSEIEEGKTYKLYINGEEKESLTVSSSGVTTNATNTGMNGGQNMKGNRPENGGTPPDMNANPNMKNGNPREMMQ